MVKVKICGITNLEDAKASVKAGCDALGFNFYKKSPRYISPEKAHAIIRQLPLTTVKIGVFVNAKADQIRQIARFCNLNILQFHGNESPEFCRKFKKYKIIKTFHIKDKINLSEITRYKTFAYLFDTFSVFKKGGTGRKFNWDILSCLVGIKKPIFLAGGLNAGNVRKAIEVTRPDWVDVCSYVETSPGKKDHEKIRVFIKAAKSKR
ncbi:MAG: phosphoribosylanthranilate isomerase [Candidatus Omnitrophica bacterium]|nr:phosphoribosylanthranilate isomerase [Candidatus Omnitrophota bacterium]